MEHVDCGSLICDFFLLLLQNNRVFLYTLIISLEFSEVYFWRYELKATHYWILQFSVNVRWKVSNSPIVCLRFSPQNSGDILHSVQLHSAGQQLGEECHESSTEFKFLDLWNLKFAWKPGVSKYADNSKVSLFDQSFLAKTVYSKHTNWPESSALTKHKLFLSRLRILPLKGVEPLCIGRTQSGTKKLLLLRRP